MEIELLKKKKVSAISLGCDKNKVDLENILFDLQSFGFEITDDVENAEIIIVNTCAFISSAISEAIENIFYATSLKENKCEKVIVTGCLPNRYNDSIKSLIENVDAFVLTKDNKNIVKTILELYNVDFKYEKKQDGRLITNLPHYSYLKIADGCNNGCAYCTIPRIRGRYISTPMEKLIKEAKMLADKGVKELILIAQDITRYGVDLYNEPRLVQLIKELSKISKIKWIRLHYCYPEMVSKDLLDEIHNNPKVCKYLDIPLQHIDDDVLKGMNRRSNEQQVRSLIQNIRQNYPEIAIRSTFIVGFPGETKKAFNKLLDFLKEVKLENVGFFAYSKEEKTKAFFMKNQVCGLVKKMRLKKAQKTQYKIMNANNIERIGDECDVIIDEFDYNLNMFYARDMKNSPNVDFKFLIDYNSDIVIGEIYKIKITDYYETIFKGEII